MPNSPHSPQPNNAQNPTWEDALQKLYRRRLDERPIQEGDPRNFRGVAAELAADRSTEVLASLIEDEFQEDSEIPEGFLGNPRLIINAWDDLLPVGFMDHEMVADDPESFRAETILGKALWELLQQFGPDEAYVFLSLIAKAGEVDRPWQSPIDLNATDLQILLGWEKPAQYENPVPHFAKILDLVKQVCDRTLTLLIPDMENKNSHHHTIDQISSPFWVLRGTEFVSRLGRTTSSRSETGFYRTAYPKDLVFHFSPGPWLTPFIEESPTQISVLVEFSRIAKGILQINPHRKKLASRLAMFLTAIEPLHSSAQYCVRDLLIQVELDKNLQNYYKTDESQTRLLVRWNNALSALKKLGWAVEFDDETYPNALRPIWRSDDEEDTALPGRFENWFATWMDGRLMVRSSPPELRIEDIRMGTRLLRTRLSRPKRSRPGVPQAPAPIAGQTLDVALTLKGWSKAQLSYQLHMDRSMVTHWIKGSRPISVEQRKRLWKILGRELLAAQKVRY